MGRILEGKPVADALKSELNEKVAALKSKNIEPSLMIIRVGNREDDIVYERSIIKACSQAGIAAQSEVLKESVTQNELLQIISMANANKDVHGIMILKPLPSRISEEAVSALLSPEKDVDCISTANITKVFAGTAKLYPCTPKAVVTLLKHYGVPLAGKHAVVCGRGMVVGKPLAMLLLSENMTVSVCHSKTEALTHHTRNADIVIAAIGKPNFFGKEYFTEKSIVIDVGVNFDENGKMCGDVDFESIKDYAGAVTPPKGGVGAITTAILISNAVSACEEQTLNGRIN